MIIDIIFLFFLSLVPIVWLIGGYSIVGYDSGFRLNGIAHITSLLHSWNPTVNYGIDWTIYRAFAVLQLPEAIVSQVTGSLPVAQTTVFVGWFMLIGLSMYIFLRNMFPESHFRFFRIFSSIYYMYNFFILNGWLNAERAKFSLYAALPIAILLMYRQAFHAAQPVRTAIAFGLLYAVWNGGGSIPLYGATIIAIGLAVIMFSAFVFRQRGLAGTVRLLGSYALFAVSFLLFNAYWIVPLIAYAHASFGSSVAAQGGIGGLIEWEKAFSRNASFLNIIRLQGFPDWHGNPSHPYAGVYESNIVLVLASLIPAGVSALGVIRFGIDSSRRFILLFLTALLAVGIFFTAGSHPPTGVIYLLLMRHMPGFAIFRSSFYKFAPTVWFSVTVLFGYFMALFIHTYVKKKYIRTIVWSMCISGILAYHYPFFSSESFTISGLFRTRVAIPRYVNQMKHAIEKKTTMDDRILVFPDLDPGFITLPMDAYTWGFYSADILPRIMTNRSFLAGDANDDAITALLYQHLYDRDMEGFHELASLAGVTHVLWRGDVALSEAMGKRHSLVEYEQTLASMEGMSLVSQSGPWKLYRNTASIRPMISIVRNPIQVTGSARGDVICASDTATIRVESPADARLPTAIGAECMMCNPDEFNTLVSSIYLPPVDDQRKTFVKHLGRRFARMKKHEQSYGELIDEKLSNVVSIISLAVHSGNKEQMSNMSVVLEQMNELYRKLSGRMQVIYANRLYAYIAAIERLTAGTVIFHDVSSIIRPLKNEVMKNIYMSDDSSFRYIVTIPQSDRYRIIGSNPLDRIIVDGVLAPLHIVTLEEGFHTIELARNGQMVAPYIFLRNEYAPEGGMVPLSFVRISPTRYEGNIVRSISDPSAIVLNQRYDPRWQLSFTSTNGKRHIITDHYEANGFANGWLVPRNTRGAFEIRYTTQTNGTYGNMLSITSLIVAAVWYTGSVRKRVTG